MPTIDQVHGSVKTRLAAQFTAIALRFRDDSTLLPDTPVPFAFVELVIEGFGFVAFGGGRGANLQRTPGHIEAHLLVPIGSESAADALAWAEAICAVFRGQRVDDINYGAAQVMPATGRSEDGNHDHIATALIDFSFDQLG